MLTEAVKARGLSWKCWGDFSRENANSNVTASSFQGKKKKQNTNRLGRGLSLSPH